MGEAGKRRSPSVVSGGRILDAIRSLTALHHRPPSLREICDEAVVSMGSLTHNLELLEADGKIRRRAGSRGIELIDTDDEAQR